MARRKLPQLCTLAAFLWLMVPACDDGGDGDPIPGSVGDPDPNHVPAGESCDDDREGCPDGYECFCSAPAPGVQRCACGLLCEDSADCTDPDQDICCYFICTDWTTCNNF